MPAGLLREPAPPRPRLGGRASPAPGEEAPSIPNGEIVRGEAGVNSGWSWHIDPSSVEFGDVTIEVCDGLPSHVEDGTLAGDRYCPWAAEVIEIEPAG